MSRDNLSLEINKSSHLRPIIIDGSNVAMNHGNKKVFSCKGIEICVNWFLSRGHEQVIVIVPQWRTEGSKEETPIENQEVLHSLESTKHLVFTPCRKVIVYDENPDNYSKVENDVSPKKEKSLRLRPPPKYKKIVCYDDRYIIKLAIEMNGIIVSNDNYRDLAMESPTFAQVIEKRLLMYTFINDRFMPPDDPLGRDGPNLDDFLKFDEITPTSVTDSVMIQSPSNTNCTLTNSLTSESVGYEKTPQDKTCLLNQSKQQQQPIITLPVCPYGPKCTYGNKCKFDHPEKTNLKKKVVTHQQAYQAMKEMEKYLAKDNSKKSLCRTFSLQSTASNSIYGYNPVALTSGGLNFVVSGPNNCMADYRYVMGHPNSTPQKPFKKKHSSLKHYNHRHQQGPLHFCDIHQNGSHNLYFGSGQKLQISTYQDGGAINAPLQSGSMWLDATNVIQGRLNEMPRGGFGQTNIRPFGPMFSTPLTLSNNYSNATITPNSIIETSNFSSINPSVDNATFVNGLLKKAQQPAFYPNNNNNNLYLPTYQPILSTLPQTPNFNINACGLNTVSFPRKQHLSKTISDPVGGINSSLENALFHSQRPSWDIPLDSPSFAKDILWQQDASKMGNGQNLPAINDKNGSRISSAKLSQIPLNEHQPHNLDNINVALDKIAITDNMMPKNEIVKEFESVNARSPISSLPNNILNFLYSYDDQCDKSILDTNSSPGLSSGVSSMSPDNSITSHPNNSVNNCKTMFNSPLVVPIDKMLKADSTVDETLLTKIGKGQQQCFNKYSDNLYKNLDNTAFTFDNDNSDNITEHLSQETLIKNSTKEHKVINKSLIFLSSNENGQTSNTLIEDKRKNLFYHLSSLFPESNVRLIMDLYPNQTDVKTLCTLLCNLS